MRAWDIVSALKQASDGPHALQNIRHVLNGWRGCLGEVAIALAYIPGTGGNANQVFYRTPELSVLKVRFPAGRRTPPHDHGSWAAILTLSGSEKNTIYRRGSDSLEYANEAVLTPGAILTMPAEAVHVVETLGGEPATGLHVYGGDVLGVERSMWDPDTLEEHPLTWDHYEILARKASAAGAAPLTPRAPIRVPKRKENPAHG